MPRADYQQRQQARKERYERRADNAEAEAARRFDAARAELEHIPPGQPILVGHYSERAHRAALRRHDRNLRASIDADNKAAHYRGRAAAVGKGGISSDDPEAVHKLRAKIERAEGNREAMKAINAAWRKAGRPEPDDTEAWRDVQAATGHTWDALGNIRLDMAKRAAWEKNPVPFPGYALSNLGGNIRRMRQRLEQLEHAAERADDDPTTTAEGDGWRIVERPDINRIAVEFDDRPPREVCRIMRHFGFRWSRKEGAWLRHLNSAGRAAGTTATTNIEIDALLA